LKPQVILNQFSFLSPEVVLMQLLFASPSLSTTSFFVSLLLLCKDFDNILSGHQELKGWRKRRTQTAKETGVSPVISFQKTSHEQNEGLRGNEDEVH
jgi:hypothetical protein